MRYVDVNGAHLSVIGLGTWQFGSKDWGYGTDYAQNEAGRIVARALDLGVNVIDTAEIYARHESERIVGRAIAGRREEVFVATKLLPIMPLAPVVERKHVTVRHGSASTPSTCTSSISRTRSCRSANRCAACATCSTDTLSSMSG